MMKRALILVAAVASLALAVGCTHVFTAQGGNTSHTNDAWFSEITTIPLGPPPGLILSSRVYYCPPTSGGAATCQEAEMIENANPGTGGGGGGEAAPAPAPAPAPAEGGGGGGETTE
jgi:hypothetical protein